MVDFSLRPLKEMLKLGRSCNLIWIDHHDTSLRMAKDHKPAGRVVLDTSKAACKLVWEYVHPTRPVPVGVELIASYDIGEQGEAALRFHYWLSSQDTEPILPIWGGVFSDNIQVINDILDQGCIMKAYSVRQSERVASMAAFTTTFGKYKAIAVNSAGDVWAGLSKIADPSHQIAISYWWNESAAQWKISLRVLDGHNITVNGLAEHYGGGGHPRAAGFSSPTLPFPPWSA